MSGATAANLSIDVLVAAYIVYRQVTTHRLRENYRLPLILGIIGIAGVRLVPQRASAR